MFGTRLFLLTTALFAVTGCGDILPTPAEPRPKPVAETPPALPPLPEDAPKLVLEDGYKSLGIEDFEAFSAKDPGKTVVWQAAGNGFDCFGKPRGYLYSKTSYSNYTLKLDYRFRRPADLTDDPGFKGNTGVMIHITGPHKQWPKSLELQGKYSEMASLKANGGAADLVIHDDNAARQSARKPVGEWNSLEVISKAGALASSINGVKVCESEAGELVEGLIGFQAEDFEVQFRNIRIRKE
jgi:hypothetical protein